jgi:DNA repair protein RAD16
MFHGGILADEMGMGKTIQTIALLLLARKPEPTLIVCPAVAIMQWRDEIERHTRPGALSVVIYHGANKGKVVEQFDDFNVVLTTYATVEVSGKEDKRSNEKKKAD